MAPMPDEAPVISAMPLFSMLLMAVSLGFSVSAVLWLAN
jgi:hypothetical protein